MKKNEGQKRELRRLIKSFIAAFLKSLFEAV
jgi:hypothetical protein